MLIKNHKTIDKNRILISLGDPAGIGFEITLKALYSDQLPKRLHPVLVGCKKNIELTYARLKEQGVCPRAIDIC